MRSQLHSDHVRPELANTEVAELAGSRGGMPELSGVEYHELSERRVDHDESRVHTPADMVRNVRS